MRTIDFFRVPVYPRSQAHKGLQKCNRISEPFYQWPRLVHVLNFEDRVRNSTGSVKPGSRASWPNFRSLSDWESHIAVSFVPFDTDTLCKDTLHDYIDT